MQVWSCCNQTILKIMKSVLNELVFDQEMVDKLKKAKLREEYMYNLLFSGKITLQEFLDGEVMRDDRRDVESALQQRRHLVPGLEHLAAVDAPHVEALEDHLVPVDGGVAGRDA